MCIGYSCSIRRHADRGQSTAAESIRVMGWYDNEWGFSNRMADTAALLGNL